MQNHFSTKTHLLLVLVVVSTLMLIGTYLQASEEEFTYDDDELVVSQGNNNPLAINRILQERIVNGTKVEVGTYPWFTFRRVDNAVYCGAILIHPDVLMTAAHCAFAFHNGNVTINATEIFDTEADNIPIKKHFVHPDSVFSSSEFKNDIMLVLLSRASNTNIQPVEWNTDFNVPIDNQIARTIGYGRVHNIGPTSNDLRQVDLNVIGYETCKLQNTITKSFLDDSTMICAGDIDTGGEGACFGDSGGPLMTTTVTNGNTVQTVIGITSFNTREYDCGSKKNPTVFTRVSPYTEWIRETICEQSAFSPVDYDCTKYQCPCQWYQPFCRLRRKCVR